MREIKFRIYSEDLETYIPICELTLEEQNAFLRGENMQDYANLIFEQSTGLKDKNNVEIYEGDILMHYSETEQFKIKEYHQVYWCKKKGAWMIDKSKYRDKSNEHLLSEELKQFNYRISGNIHQQKI